MKKAANRATSRPARIGHVVVTCLVAGVLTVPAATGSAAATEQDGFGTETVTGVATTVVREHRDAHAGAADDTDTVLTTDEGVVELTEDSEVPVGREVTVELAEAPGEEMEVVDVVDVGATTAASSAAVERAGTAPAVRNLYVGIVTPAGYPNPNTHTVESVTAMVAKVDDYWSAQTGGEVRFQVAEVRAYQSAYACGQTGSMWNEAPAKFSTSSYGTDKHLLLVAPNGSDAEPYGCDYGLGTVGALHTQGNAAFVSAYNQSLWAHELGHNLGLHHANALSCTSTSDAVVSYPMPSGCYDRAYDDLFDVMGYSGPAFGEGSLNIAHVEDLGIESDELVAVPADTEVTLTVAPLADAAATTRGVKAVDTQGNVYFVQYRSGGRDSAASAANYYRPQLGVQVVRENPKPGYATGSYVLDASPTGAGNDYARALKPGATFTSHTGLVKVRVISQSASGATVTVTNGTPPGTETPTTDVQPEPRLEPLPQPEPTPVRLRVLGRAALNPTVVNTVGVRAVTESGVGAADVRVRVCTTDVRTGATACFARVTNGRGYSSITVTRPRNGLVVAVHETDADAVGTSARRLLRVRPPVSARVVRRTVTARVAATGRSVTLLQRQVGRGRWATVSRRPTNLRGVVRYVRPLRGRYRVVAAPATGRLRSVSRVVRV